MSTEIASCDVSAWIDPKICGGIHGIQHRHILVSVYQFILVNNSFSTRLTQNVWRGAHELLPLPMFSNYFLGILNNIMWDYIFIFVQLEVKSKNFSNSLCFALCFVTVSLLSHIHSHRKLKLCGKAFCCVEQCFDFFSGLREKLSLLWPVRLYCASVSLRWVCIVWGPAAKWSPVL